MNTHAIISRNKKLSLLKLDKLIDFREAEFLRSGSNDKKFRYTDDDGSEKRCQVVRLGSK